MASGLKENRAPQGNGVQGDASLKTIVNPNISGVNFGKIADQANQTYDPEMAKYYAAVDLARQEFSGNEEVNEKMFRKEIDRIYKDKLQGTLNPDTDIRGNNVMSQAIRGLNEGYDDLLSIAGNAIDKPWDVIAGGIADATGQHKAADKLRNLMDGRDVGTALDIGADIALMANPMTMPIGVAKALIQQSDNIDEAIKGRDNVTLEDLTGTQRAARGGEAALNTALAALPGVGKAGKVLKAAKADEVATSLKGAKETAKTLGEKASKASDDVTKAKAEYESNLADLAKQQEEAASKVKSEAIQRMAGRDAKFLNEAKQAKVDVDNSIDALAMDDAAILGNEMASAREIAEAAEKARTNANEIDKLANSSYPIRVAKIANDQSRAMRDAIKNIPARRRELAEVEEKLPGLHNFNPDGLDPITKLPRTRRGMRKLMNEDEGYKRFGISDKAIKDMSASRKRQLADQTAAAVRQKYGRTPLTGALKDAMNQIGDATKAENFSNGLYEEEFAKMLDKLKANEKIKGTPTEKLKNLRNMVASSLSGVGALGVQGGLAGMSTGDYDNFQQGVMATFNDIEQHPWKFLPGLFPIGAKRASMRMTPGLKGDLGSSIPFNAARGAALGNYITSQTEPDTSKATNEEEILKRLAALKAGE